MSQLPGDVGVQPAREPDVVGVRVVETELPTRHGTFRCIGYRFGEREHVALVVGDPGRSHAPLVRLHSECLTGDAFGSARCDCGDQLDSALRSIAAAGVGVVVYLRGHEGRGIGLIDKLRAYRLQDHGRDTVDANLELGHAADLRDYRDAVGVLEDLGLRRIRLLTNNPNKTVDLVAHGIDVAEQVPIVVDPTPQNERYLITKRDRMGHQLSGLGSAPPGEGN